MLFFKHSPYSSCRDSISNHNSIRGSRGEGGGVFKLPIFTNIKITEKGLGPLWEKFLDPRMYREWLKCMQSKIDEQYSFACSTSNKIWHNNKSSLYIMKSWQKFLKHTLHIENQKIKLSKYTIWHNISKPNNVLL